MVEVITSTGVEAIVVDQPPVGEDNILTTWGYHEDPLFEAEYFQAQFRQLPT